MSSAQLALEAASTGPFRDMKHILPGAAVWMALIILTLPIREVSLWEFGAAHGRIGDLVLAACFALWLASGCLRGELVFATNALDRAVLFFLVVYAASILWAESLGFGLYQLTKLLRNGVLYLLLVHYLSESFPQRYRQIAICLLVTGLIQTLAFAWSIGEYGGLAALSILLNAESVKSSDSVLNVVRSDQGAGVFLRGVASWLPLCMFAGFSIVSFIRQRTGRIGIWLLFVVMGLMTVLSATRSAWIGLAAGFAVIVALTAGEITVKKFMLGGLFVVMLGVGLASLNLHTFIQGRFAPEVLLQDRAIQDRYDYFEIAFDAFLGSPVVGKGVGSISQDELFIVHNVYLQVLGELGVMGAAILAVVIGLWIWALLLARKLARNCGDGFCMRVSATILGATAFFLTYFLAGHDLAGGEPWIVLGVASAVLTYEQRCVLSSPYGLVR